VILHAAANLRIAAFGGHKEVGRPFGTQAEMEIKGNGSSVKRRAQIGRGRRKRQAQRAI
jgi:hypothetical protein